jgi:hypothetical protein
MRLSLWVCVVSALVVFGAPGARAQVVSAGGTSPAGSAENAALGELAVGSNSAALGQFGTAIGNGAEANAQSSTAVGITATANGTRSTATGFDAQTGAAGDIAMGSESRAGTGSAGSGGNIAIGSDANTVDHVPGSATVANGGNTIAIGTAAKSTGGASTALGAYSQASGSSATAVGYGATAAYSNSAAFGSGATATANNEVAIGTASNTYKLSGLTSAASLAAQSGPVSLVTTDAAGHLATTNITVPDISGLQSTVSGLQSSVGVLQHQMRQSFEGTAIAISMGGGALPADKRFAISTNWGNFHGENAASVVAQMRLTDYAVVNVGVGAGFEQGGIGSRAGVTFAW